jgi:effector-binding domain-containing protein
MNQRIVHSVAESPVEGVEVVTTDPRHIMGLRERVATTELSRFFARALPDVTKKLHRAGVDPAGPPVAIYRDEHDHDFEVTVGFPVDRVPILTYGLVCETLPGGRMVRAIHTGPYDSLPQTYARLGAWFAQQTRTPPRMMWEEYLVGPDETGESNCITELVFPLD